MLSRKEMEQELYNMFLNQQNKSRDGYIKKLRGKVDSALTEEYNLIVKGVAPKVKKERVWKSDKE